MNDQSDTRTLIAVGSPPHGALYYDDVRACFESADKRLCSAALSATERDIFQQFLKHGRNGVTPAAVCAALGVFTSDERHYVSQNVAQIRAKMKEAGIDGSEAIKFVRGTGRYILQLPDPAAAAAAPAPAAPPAPALGDFDGVYGIDAAFMAANRVDIASDDAIDVLTAYYSMRADTATILQVACSDAQFCGDDYQALIRELHKRAFASQGPVFLMAEGGTGKTTLLASTAVHACKSGDRVVYLDAAQVSDAELAALTSQLKQLANDALDSRSQQLCFYNIAANDGVLLQRLHGWLRGELPAKLALLLCERIDRSMDLLLSNDDRNFELWARHARAALLLNRSDEEAVQLAKSQLMPLLVEFFKVDNVATLPFAFKLRSDMLAWAVERLIALYELDEALAQRIRGQLGMGDISVAYQLVEFQRRYNAESDDAALPSRRKRFSFIWDDWADKTADVPTPRQPGAVAMSDAFKYLAAYKILVGNPSIAMLARLCSGTPVETRILLQERFPAGASLLWANAGQVVFGHDSLADQYFFLNPKVPLQVCLEYLLDTASLDDESVVDFARAAFSPALIHHHQLIPAGVDLDRLLRCFTAQPSLMQVMVDEQKLYKVELARVYLDAVRASERGVDVVADARYGQALGESFRRLIDRGQEPVINLWNRYFLAALGICEQLPQPMVGYACETTETRCAVTSRLSKIRRSIGNWNWVGEDDRWRELVFAESLLSRFVQLDPADRIGCFEWVMTLRELGRYQEARQAAHDHILDVDPAGEAADVDVSLLCNVRHTVIESYSDELKELGKAGGSYYKRRDLEQHIRVEYEALIAQARAAGLEADGYVQKFARFEKDTKQFQHAYSLLQDLPDSERKMLELGMLYSSSNLKFDSRAHKLFNLDKAIACYVKAWHFQQERRNVKAREKLSILYPLASALFQDRRLADASQVCHYALCFKREKKVLDLLAKLGEDDKRRNELPDILR